MFSAIAALLKIPLLNNILIEIYRLGIRRKSDEEMMAEAEDRADRLLKK